MHIIRIVVMVISDSSMAVITRIVWLGWQVDADSKLKGDCCYQLQSKDDNYSQHCISKREPDFNGCYQIVPALIISLPYKTWIIISVKGSSASPMHGSRHVIKLCTLDTTAMKNNLYNINYMHDGAPVNKCRVDILCLIAIRISLLWHQSWIWLNYSWWCQWFCLFFV